MRKYLIVASIMMAVVSSAFAESYVEVKQKIIDVME